jgi:DNA-binding response OmpR family regulator
LLFYEALLPGSQLANRLQDLGYEVLTHTRAATLAAQARQSKPLVLIADLESRETDLCQVIRELTTNPDTAHIPILAFSDDDREQARIAAHDAGATLVAGSSAVLAHLPQLLEQALEAGL